MSREYWIVKCKYADVGWQLCKTEKEANEKAQEKCCTIVKVVEQKVLDLARDLHHSLVESYEECKKERNMLRKQFGNPEPTTTEGDK